MRALLLLSVFLIAAPPPGALAQTGAPPGSAASAVRAQTVTGALERYFAADSTDPAVGELNKAQFAFNRLLVAEVLPGGKALLAEVALSKKGMVIRYPIKLERDETQPATTWRVTWAPDVAFARALVGACEGRDLAPLQVGRPWEDFHRLPAFPVIVGPGYFVTPFGKIDEKSGARATAAAASLHPPEELTRHVQRWTGQVMLDDPASANVDLLLHAGVTWKHATRALMAPAMQGLFRIHFVGHGPRGLYAVSAAAPVFKEATATTQSSAVIAMSALPAHNAAGDVPGYAFRVRVGEQMLGAQPAAASPPASSKEKDARNSDAPSSDTHADTRSSTQVTRSSAQVNCDSAATFCARTLDDFRARIKQSILARPDGHKAPPTQVLLAATGDLPATVVVNHLGSVLQALEMTTERVFAGYSAATE